MNSRRLRLLYYRRPTVCSFFLPGPQPASKWPSKHRQWPEAELTFREKVMIPE